MEQIAEKRVNWQERQRNEQSETKRDVKPEELRIESLEQSWNDSEDKRSDKSEPENSAGRLPKFGESRLGDHTFDHKSKSIRYFKGLFGRIIVACFLFLLLFLGRMFSVNLVDQSTESVINEVRNNKFVESLEEKLSALFEKPDNKDSEIEK